MGLPLEIKQRRCAMITKPIFLIPISLQPDVPLIFQTLNI